MGDITFEVDDQLKEKSYEVLNKLGVSPSDALRQTLEYIAESGRLPFKTTPNTDDDDLLQVVRERLKDPQPIRVSLDDL